MNRDLDADLQSVFGVGVEYVELFCIRGDYDLDDLRLYDGEVETSYYYFGNQRVAMRKNDVVQYLISDYLGTTSAVLNADGSLASEARHYPNGEERWSSGTLPTDRRWTGEREDGYIKLYQMGARWYDHALGRWVSPDSIVPNPANPQSFNRYSYGYNNPVKFRDPSGHEPEFPMIDGVCSPGANCPTIEGLDEFLAIAWMLPDDAAALILLFETDLLGDDPSASARLERILQETALPPDFIPRQFKIEFGESGFAPELQDGYLYAALWTGSSADSNQVGHFLTAVRLGYDPTISEDFSLRAIVGHEQVPDGTVRSILAPAFATGEELAIFRQAVSADTTGDYRTRDSHLAGLLGPGSLAKRKGNSIEDLRLSVRGWRMGQMIAGGALATRQDVGLWLRSYIAASR